MMRLIFNEKEREEEREESAEPIEILRLAFGCELIFRFHMQTKNLSNRACSHLLTVFSSRSSFFVSFFSFSRCLILVVPSSGLLVYMFRCRYSFAICDFSTLFLIRRVNR